MGLMLHVKSSPAVLRGYSSLIHVLPKKIGCRRGGQPRHTDYLYPSPTTEVFGEVARATSIAAISETAHPPAVMLWGRDPCSVLGQGGTIPPRPRRAHFHERELLLLFTDAQWFWGNANRWLVTLTAMFS